MLIPILALVALERAAMPADIFLKLKDPSSTAIGVSGTAASASHKEWIPLNSMSEGSANSINLGTGSGGAGSGKASFKVLDLEKTVDQASIGLTKAVATGHHYDEGMIDVVKSGSFESYVFFRLRLKLVYVESLAHQVSANDLFPMERLKLEYGAAEWTYWPQSKAGSPGTPVQSHWSVIENSGGAGAAPWAGGTQPAAPTISPIEDQTVAYGKARTIGFQVGDPDSSLSSLVITKESSVPALVPLDSIVISGSGGNRTVQITPAPGQSGISVIKLRVSDGALFAERSFTFTVNPNLPPTIAPIPSQSLRENGTLQVDLSIGDTETSPDDLELSASHTQPGVLPLEFTFSGSGPTRQMKIKAPGGTGDTDVSVRVSDGDLATTRTFKLTVVGTEAGAPTNLSLDPAVVEENSPVGTAVGTLLASDPDSGDTFVFQLAGAETRFAIVGNEVRVAGPLDFETADHHKITVRVTDSHGLTLVRTLEVGVLNVNEKPEIATGKGVKTGKNHAASVSGLSLADPDAGGQSIRVVLSVENGRLDLRSDVQGGVHAGQIESEEPFHTLAVTAPIAALNKTLASRGGLSYTPLPNFTGSDTLHITADDRGHSGSGEPQQDQASLFVDVFDRSLDAWRNKMFKAEELGNPELDEKLWGLKADPEGDGRDNLLEYALDLDPAKKEDKNQVIQSDVVIDEEQGDTFLQISFKRRRDDPNLEYVPEVKDENGNWQPANQKLDLVGASPDSPETELVTYRFREPVQPGKPQIYRVKVRLNQ